MALANVKLVASKQQFASCWFGERDEELSRKRRQAGLHIAELELADNMAKSEVAILINLPASFQLTSGQPHRKLHSLLLNQAGETEAEAGERGKYEVVGIDKQSAGEGGPSQWMTERELKRGERQQLETKKIICDSPVWLKEKRTKEIEKEG
ncbi:unnamed protein product [Pleuronectes platessa]|uniref:Uncharacterized protein n=1 Tax=Pleuronectes platessa TaxID=8262 RepID=A0A9N7VP89_PLEPL|nr:unnamed protein product [Pleuronectes platessa]